MPLDTLEKGINVKNLSLDVPAKNESEWSFDPESIVKDEHWRLLKDNLDRIYDNAQMDPKANWIKIAWILAGFKTFAPQQMDMDRYVDRINWDQTFKALQKRPDGSDWYGFIITASNLTLLNPDDPKLMEMANKYKQQSVGHLEFLKEQNIGSQAGNVARGLWILHPDIRKPLEQDQALFDLMKETVQDSERTKSWENSTRNAASLKIMYPEKTKSGFLSTVGFQSSADKFKDDLNFIKFWRDDQSFIPFSQLGASLRILSAEAVKIGPNGFEFTNNQPQLPSLASPQPQTRKF